MHLHALRALKDAYQVQLQLDEAGTLEIKMRFTSAVPKSAELFSHFFLCCVARRGRLCRRRRRAEVVDARGAARTDDD